MRFFTLSFLSPSAPPPEDGSGDGISTVSGSRNPLQPPDTSSEEPFTTYFDSKIPIPEDETVGASPAGNRAGKSPAGGGCWGGAAPLGASCIRVQLGSVLQGWDRGGRRVSKLALGLMIHPG